ncbi:MAG: hypothetical protein ACI4EK_07485 [Wujia sp.]
MSFFAKLERKYGKYSVKNLPVKMAVVMAIGYFLWAFMPDFASNLIFSPYEILVNHQYWRLFTWIFSPPGEISFIGILMIFCLILFGRYIEQAMGTFMFNIYVFGCWAWNTIIMLGISLFYFATLSSAEFMLFGLANPGILAMYYFDYGIFLGFALMYSDSTVLFMFVLPIRAFWIAVLDMLMMAYEFVNAGSLLNRGSIVAYLLNFFIFYLIMGRGVGMRGSNSKSAQKKRQKEYERRMQMLSQQVNDEAQRRKNVQKGEVGKPKHKCAVCGRTELDDSTLEFRYCSKCNGAYEYCNEHLFTHEHVK